jgi:imidazolonepropionase-like amidohydrolase
MTHRSRLASAIRRLRPRRPLRRSALALAFGLAVSGPVAAESIRYSVVSFGKTTGAQVVERRGHDLSITYEYADRGRGPKITQSVRLDRDGIPTRLTVTGHDYLKAPVDERFEVEGRRAHWASAAETGEVESGSTPAFYVSGNGVPYEIGLLVRALQARPDHRLALLPAGEAALGASRAETVEVDGVRRTVTRVELLGLGFAPTAVWMDADGEWFGSVSAWQSIVRSGGEPFVDRLVEIDRAAAAEHWKALAQRAARRPRGVLAIRGARLFDAATLAVREHTTVLVEGDRIVAVGDDRDVTPPADAEILDAAGRTLIPGLWDMHSHVGDLSGPLNLAHGVTTVRDLANDPDELRELRRVWSGGEALGPRVEAAGFIDGPGPYAGPSKALVETPEAGVEWVRRYAADGYRQIKMYSSLRPELVAPIAREAHRLGLRVSGHVPATMTAEQAIRAGYDELQHINFVVLNFFPEVTETRTPARFTEVAERAADLDLGSPAVIDFLRLLAARGIVVDPTINVFDSMFRDRSGTMSSSCAAVVDRLPVTVRRGCFYGGLPVPEGKDARYLASADQLRSLLRAMWRAGVPLVAGTDALPGVALHHELDLWASAGIPSAEILRAATFGAARVMGRDGELGRVAPGYRADLVLVAGRPDEDIAQVRRITDVIADGRIVDVGEVTRTLGMKPAF